MDCMDWNLFWSAFGAIGGSLGAFATACAVIVALWQTKYSQKKKIRLDFNEDITIVPQNAKEFYRYVGVKVVNIGNRDIVINSWGFKLHNGERVVIVKDKSPISSLIQVDLPHRLAIEESIDLVYSKKFFLEVLLENRDSSKVQKDRKLKFYVVDSTGKVYIVKTTQKVGEIIEKIKKQV